ncbi:MAG TPA: PEGA domain-containing protein, partial [Polyangia bacterium]
VVHVDTGNARIELDGTLVAQAASGARLGVDAGTHEVGVTAPGRHRYSGKVAVGRGATVELAVHLRHEAEPAATAPKPAAAKNKPERRDPDYLVDPFSGSK